MMLTGRTVVLLVTMALATGGAAWGVHALTTPGGDVGTDYGLDTNGNGKFDWLVVEAQLFLPEAGTWDVYADLSGSSSPPSGSCGYPSPPPMALMDGTLSPVPSSYAIGYVYERYFFPAGTQTVRMAFAGTDIARAAVDGPYAVHARLSLDGFPDPRMEIMPIPVGPFVEWNYSTKAYAASDFEPPVRSAYFTGAHSDSAVDLDGNGLADFLELRADVRVNLPGQYSLSGYLSTGGADAVRFIVGAYRTLNLTTGDTSVSLRFRGDQIYQAGVDGPWDFSLTLYGPIDIVYANGTLAPAPLGGILPPQPVYYPETLCGTTSPYRATDFDDTIELLRFTGRFEELTPDRNGDGTYDALVIRAEVEVFAAAAFDIAGVLRASSGSVDIAKSYGQAWLQAGVQWTEFSFAGPDIRSSGIDGPYEAALSITPGTGGIDPTTTYTTLTYKATDFDPGYTIPAQP